MKQPKVNAQKPKLAKNQEEGLFKDKMGHIHLGKQDLSKMATAKMKGLRKHKHDDVEEPMEEDNQVEPEDEPMEIVEESVAKKRKTKKSDK